VQERAFWVCQLLPPHERQVLELPRADGHPLPSAREAPGGGDHCLQVQEERLQQGRPLHGEAEARGDPARARRTTAPSAAAPTAAWVSATTSRRTTAAPTASPPSSAASGARR